MNAELIEEFGSERVAKTEIANRFAKAKKRQTVDDKEWEQIKGWIFTHTYIDGTKKAILMKYNDDTFSLTNRTTEEKIKAFLGKAGFLFGFGEPKSGSGYDQAVMLARGNLRGIGKLHPICF